eukprot:scaffold457271_cov30-Prasinocladus_malaysianus.AAC.5
MDYQDFDSDTKRYVFGLMGRMMFRIKQLDTWEAIPFFFGVEGTGKSLCIKLISKLYNSHTVVGLASKADGNFQLEGFVGKDVIVTIESKNNLLQSISEADLKSMASGEAITVNRKGRAPFFIEKWEIPMAFASNHLPNFRARTVRQSAEGWPLFGFQKSFLLETEHLIKSSIGSCQTFVVEY